MRSNLQTGKKHSGQPAVAETLQKKEGDKRELVQSKFSDKRPAREQQEAIQKMADGYCQNNPPAIGPVQKKSNGLPENLQNGIENLSGISMQNVNVHYNSTQPAQLQALAFAQGNNIHLGPGQEKHLPHEAWHVVQQKQGRVKPTIQMKTGTPVNNDPGLEKEADVMGAKALGSVQQYKTTREEKHGTRTLQTKSVYPVAVQRVEKVDNPVDGPIVAFHLGRDLDLETSSKLMDGIGRTTIRNLGTNLILNLMRHTNADHLIEVVLNLTEGQIRQLGEFEKNYAANVFSTFLNLPFAKIQQQIPLVEAEANITHVTPVPAPDGSPNTRTDVGVGELVVFNSNTIGNWTAASGAPLNKNDVNTIKWRAPKQAAANVAIKFKFKALTEKEATVNVNVVEPNQVTGVKQSEINYRDNYAGAGMKIKFTFHPLNVSFGNIKVKEVSGPASNVTGYYEDLQTNHGDSLYHDSGDKFIQVKPNNEDSAVDKAATGEETVKPYTDGTYDWVIPYHFQVNGQSGETHFTDVTQAHQIWASGRVRISKAGAVVDRTPANP